jgi:hypothetical protein
MNDYVVALVFSNWTVGKINDFMEDYLDARKADIGLSKIERYKDKKGGLKDSNRTLLLLKRQVYEKALLAGLDLQQPNLDFKISEFELLAKHYPNEGYSSNLFIRFPSTLPTEEGEALLKERMKVFIDFGLLKEEDYSLKIPLTSRITGENRGFALCNFSDSVDVKIRALIRCLIHDCFLYLDIETKTTVHLSALWTKKFVLPPVPEYRILKK